MQTGKAISITKTQRARKFLSLAVAKSASQNVMCPVKYSFLGSAGLVIGLRVALASLTDPSLAQALADAKILSALQKISASQNSAKCPVFPLQKFGHFLQTFADV
ncbi:MAG: hypothetical protein MH252_03645 [Thermosynechococcaceae cyanobacterium MS004]|nr:hypothetical protein [Thermosynechococcaceae cyanobacterium MS004]